MRLHLLGRILAAQALSSLGTSVSNIALAFMVYELTGSVLHMGAIMAVSTLPLVATSLVGGALIDRYSARTVMVSADLGRAVLIFLLPFLAGEAVGLVYLVAALMGILSSFFNPGQIKLVGELSDSGRLVRANSYLGVSRDGAELVGYLLGGVLVTYIGYVSTFAVDAGTYLISAVLLVGLSRARPRPGPVPALRTLVAGTPGVVADIWRRPQLRTNLLLAVFATMAIMMSIPNAYGLALDVFDKGPSGLATVEVLIALGLIAGGLAISRFTLQGDKNRYVALGAVAMGLCFIAVSLSPLFWLSAILLGLAGVANVCMFVPSITMFQELPDEARKGRLIAVRSGFGQLGSTVGLLLGGALGEELGIQRLFLVAGILGIGLSLLIYLPGRRAAVRQTDALLAPEVEDGVSLSPAEAEGLAGSADPVWPAPAVRGSGRSERGRRGIL